MPSHIDKSAVVRPISFDIPGLRIAALRSNEGARHRVLAVHGWLDNANSFLPLMRHLADVDLVAIDLPGHGHSGHLPDTATYHFADMPYYFFKIAEQLNWPSFHFLGHSLGGCLAPFTAVCNPEPVRSITMLEASGPLSEPVEKLPGRVQRSFQDRAKFENYQPRTFNTVDDGVDARLLATTMSRDAAQLIVERQMQPAENGRYRWRYDPKHRLASPIYMAEEQVLAMLAAVDCPAMVVASASGYVLQRPESQRRMESLDPLRYEVVRGDHHMHMDDPEPTALLIEEFLNEL